jgi:two-component system chemotaxis response regulator CheY
MRKVILVGHCGADAAYLRIAVSCATKSVSIIAADDDESLQHQIDAGADLLLINRLLSYGFETDEGVDLIKQLHQKHPRVRMMLVSNYPEAQQAAVAAGALPGFGKSQIGAAHVKEMLRTVLG